MEEQSDTPRTDAAEQFVSYFGWQVHADFVRDLERELAVVKRERDEARADLGIERMRLAACGVIALANTPESAARDRDILPQYRSASSDDVARAVDREMLLRAEVERLRKTLDEIATYWNGSHRPAETLDAAEWTRGVAEEALAATEPETTAVPPTEAP